ncbi:transposase [Georgenia satyanarayanai]|uniref:helix-turn-helix domain-containing protein n=1 Tax=Georgenia satyanarayanai TaxID=860221 RepID=UPI0020421F8B|nr:helix-turn-helix domain-containing protein [Georgenia satyanarayanai]MCM3660375.1 transposase [Georgenia satyanarayanai]
MSVESLDVSVGARLWYQGSAWTVVEHDGDGVMLRSGDHFRKVHAPSLVGAAESLDYRAVQHTDTELDAIVLAALSSKQRAEVERQATVFDELVLAPSETPANDRYQAAAEELGISLRTAYRRGQRYAEKGLIGLVDTRRLQPRRPTVDPEWDVACLEVLQGYRDLSNPTIKSVLRKTDALFLAQHPQAALPSRSVAYLRIRELDKGRYTFGAAKQRRSVAERPQGVLGRLRADRPGQYVVLDTTRLDVFAMEPITGRWLNTELTVAMDLHSRCILGLALRAVSTKAQDVATVLFQVATPQQWGPAPADEVPAPYVGVPDNLITLATGALPDTIVVDHGKVYLAEHTKAVCHRLGINIQPAIPHKPTDKPTIERFFRTLRQQLLEHLPAYKGPDVYSRGKDVETEAFYYVSELEAIIREWVGIYHHTPHQGLCDPRLPHVELSPAEMFARGMAAAGVLRLPASQDLRMEFLDVAWRTIQHYGVEIDGRRYDGPGLNLHRGVKSTYGGAHPGRWPIMVDRDDVRTVFFRDPDTREWHELVWEHAPGLQAPFSAEAAAYTRGLSLKSDRHVDPGGALADLLDRYSKGAVTSRREQNLARRLATQPTSEPGGGSTPAEVASTPGVIDLLAHLERRRAQPQVSDDLDVFERYYAEHPDEEVFEVFDE